MTGFDDVEEARDTYPMLTTVEACPENFARCAMEIIKKAERGEKLEKQYYISTQNQYRNSCGCKEAEEAKQIFRKQFEKISVWFTCISRICLWFFGWKEYEIIRAFRI